MVSGMINEGTRPFSVMIF